VRETVALLAAWAAKLGDALAAARKAGHAVPRSGLPPPAAGLPRLGADRLQVW
jgi:hypothetical protein